MKRSIVACFDAGVGLGGAFVQGWGAPVYNPSVAIQSIDMALKNPEFGVDTRPKSAIRPAPETSPARDGRRVATGLAAAMAPAFRLLNPETAASALADPPKKSESKRTRQTFKLTLGDQLRLDGLKARCRSQGQAVKKGELLRAGLRLLASLEPEALILALNRIEGDRLSPRPPNSSWLSDPDSASPTPVAGSEPDVPPRTQRNSLNGE